MVGLLPPFCKYFPGWNLALSHTQDRWVFLSACVPTSSCGKAKISPVRPGRHRPGMTALYHKGISPVAPLQRVTADLRGGRRH